MMNMTVRNLPRGCGKTTTIKLAIAEMVLEKAVQPPKIVLVTHNTDSAEEYRWWARAYNIDITVYSQKLVLYGQHGPLMVFIDEPFLLSENIQECIIKDLNSFADNYDTTVVALGTLSESHTRPTFKDLI